LSAISSLLALTPGLSETYISTARPRTSSITGTAAASAISSTVRRRLDLLGPEAVPGHVDHVVDSAENSEVAVSSLHGARGAQLRIAVPG
jgi:hypothetical protein